MDVADSEAQASPAKATRFPIPESAKSWGTIELSRRLLSSGWLVEDRYRALDHVVAALRRREGVIRTAFGLASRRRASSSTVAPGSDCSSEGEPSQHCAIYYAGHWNESPLFRDGADQWAYDSPLKNERGSAHFADVTEYAVADYSRISALRRSFDIASRRYRTLRQHSARATLGPQKLSDFWIGQAAVQRVDASFGRRRNARQFAPEAVPRTRWTCATACTPLASRISKSTLAELPCADSGSSISERLRAHQEHPV